MKRKYIILIVCLLLVLNVWRWWPSKSIQQDGTSGEQRENQSVSLSLDSTIYANKNYAIKIRDIFNYDHSSATGLVKSIKDETSSNRNKHKTVLVKKHKMSGSGNNEKRLRLAGVLIKKDIKHAFILSNGKERALSEGDVLNGRYKVSVIEPLSVKLINITTKHAFVLSL